MAIKRYIAEKDSTISDGFKPNLVDRAYDSNTGASDSLEIYSLYGQKDLDSLEKSRILVQFPIQDIKKDRDDSKIPSSGSVKFFLRLFNVKHPFSLPKDYFTEVCVVSSSWDEGYGLDMENYSDYGWNNTKVGSGVTWKTAISGNLWQTPGADILENQLYKFAFYFKDGTEDLELDVTKVVEDWISDEISNNGFLVKMSGSYEDGTFQKSFYTKKFSARGSEFFFNRPALEARWEAISTDDRGQFYASSSLLSYEDNTMNIYFYNIVNGTLKNIVNNPDLSIKFYSDDQKINEIVPNYVNISNPSRGVYKAKVIIDTTASILYDTWCNSSSEEEYFSSSIDVNKRQNYDSINNEEYIINIINNKLAYNSKETAKFKIFIREKDWQPTIYKKAYDNLENIVLNDLYYKVFRLNDNYTIIDYSTGSLAYTKTSYDHNGNYFDLDMSIFEKKYNYGIKLARWNGIELQEFPTTFKFKVE